MKTKYFRDLLIGGVVLLPLFASNVQVAESQTCDPAPSGLVSWWRAEGDASDAVGANNGTLLNGVTFTNGEVGQAFSFNGSGGVTIPDSTSLDGFTNHITIEAWIKANQTNVNPDWVGIVTKGNSSWRLQGTAGAKTVTFTIQSLTDLTGTRNVNDGRWHHVAAAYDGTNMLLYVDGTLDVSRAITGSIPQNSAPMGIGYNPQGALGSPAYFFNGLIDEVSLYNRALSSSEVAAIYHAGSSGKCPVPPIILAQPTNQTVAVGDTATFNVSADGSAPLFYQWSLDGTNIVDATNSSLVLANVQLSQAGDYAVQIANAAGSTNSLNATLTVNPPPCASRPSGLVSWWPGEGNAHDIAGANNGTLLDGVTFTNGKVGQAFRFTGGDDGVGNPAVQIPFSPSLVTSNYSVEAWINPASQVTNADQQCLVFGEGNGSVQLIVRPGSAGVKVAFQFATDPSSFYDVVSTNDIPIGQFSHVVGTWDGTVLRLYINGMLNNQNAPGVQPVASGCPFYIGGFNNPVPGSCQTLSQYFNGFVDEVSYYNRALSAAEIQSLFVAGETGKCPVPPIILAQPTNQTVAVGDTATFNVSANGSAPLFYQWNFNGTNIADATNATLTLTNVQLGQAGNYAVQVNNVAGSTNSVVARLTVISPQICTPAPSGLVAWWPAEGNANDIVGTNNGTLLNGVTFTNGEVGQTFAFNGASAVAIPDSPSLDDLTNQITIEAWIRAGQTNTNPDWEGIVTKGNSSWWLQAVAGAKTVYFAAAGTSGVEVYGTRDVNDGQWHHVAAVYDGTNLLLYVDGMLDASKPSTGLIQQNSSPVGIGYNAHGCCGVPAYFFNGLIDEVSIYHRALSASQIQDIYRAGRLGKCPVPPIILAQPTNQTVAVGDTATFNVSANGSAPLFYQWSLDGTNIVGATNSSLVLSDVQLSQAGEYAVQIANAGGSTNSAAARLTVGSSQVCTPAPSGLVAWWPGEGNAKDIVGTNNGIAQNITYPNGEVGRAFAFIGSGSSYVRIPASPSVDVGRGDGFSLELWCNPTTTNFSSNPMTLVEWNNNSGAFTGIGCHLEFYNGGEILGDIVDPNTGNDHVVATAGGNVTPNVWQHVAMTYDRTTGILALYRNGVMLTNGNVGIWRPSTSFDLYLGKRPAGIFAPIPYQGMLDEVSLYNRALSPGEVAAIYHAGSSGKCFGPPIILAQPTNQTVTVGDTATFNVSANGLAPLFYQWSFNGTNIIGATNSSLVLANVQFNQAGIYAVQIANAGGSTNSLNALLTVNHASTNIPVITAFSPASGSIGTLVTITGLNFSPVIANNTVYFGGVRAVVDAASETNLVVTVPAGAGYAPITETVSGLTAYSPAPFLPTFPGAGPLANASLAARLDLGGDASPDLVRIGDLDGDGKPDLVVHNGHSPSISIFRNISTNGLLTAGSFAPRIDLPIKGGLTNAVGGLALADLTGDGRLDIVTCSMPAGKVCIFQNFCRPGTIASNSFGAQVDLPVSGGPDSLAVQDLDGDGRPDIVTVNFNSGTVSVLRNLGGAGVLTSNAFAAPVAFPAVAGARWVAIADLDGDGKPDVATVNYNDSSGVLSVLRNTSAVGTISSNSFAPKVDFPTLPDSDDVKVCDMDGDGKLDLVIAEGANGQAVSVYRNTSVPGSLTLASRQDFGVGGWGNGVAVGDLNGDTKPDVAVVTQLPSHLSLFRNLSTPGSFTDTSLGSRLDFASGSNPQGVVIGDLNGDGRPDVVFANNYSATVSVYQNVIGIRPFIVSQPISQTNLFGTTAKFTVVANGSTPLSYQWNFEGTNIFGATNASLTLTNVQFNQAGNYTVFVTNLYGAVLSSNALLVVNPSLHFVWNPIASPRFAGAPFTIVVQAQNPTNGLATDFTNTVALLTTNGIVVSPSVSGNFVQGVWTGAVTIAQTGTNLVLKAEDSLGETGVANPINVVNLPVLATTPAGSTLYLFWPTNPSGFVLETSPDLSPGSWTPVTASPVRINNQYVEAFPAMNTNAFYRLRFTGR